MKTVMIVGLGKVGASALELLARSEGVDRLVTCDVDEVLAVLRTNAAAVGSTYQGFSKRFDFRRVDVVNDVDATSALLQEIRPEVVLFSVVLQPRRSLRALRLPQWIHDNLETAGLGALMPWHILPLARFVQAVEKSGVQTHVVSAAFCDLASPAVWNRFGFGPVVGGGNIARRVANITKHVSTTEGVPIHDITVYMVGSHAVGSRGPMGGVPFFLKILLGDRDITANYDVNWLIDECLTGIRWRVERENPESVYTLIAASFVRNVMAILRDTNQFLHAPAPNGLPGGYPMRLSARGAQVVLPQELTLEEAVRINEEGNKFDGAEKIKEDGTIVYTDAAYSAMKELGYDCRELHIELDELEARSNELRELYRKLSETAS